MDDWAGQVLVFDGPFAGDFHVNTSTSRFYGDPADHVRMVEGVEDLDGDGRRDTLVGALVRGGTGAVGVITHPVAGDARVWDVADHVVDGVAYGEELGMHVVAGDLDGDGHADLYASAPFGDGHAYVLRGPTFGTNVADASWTIRGSQPAQWLGYSGLIEDLDGDGSGDLVVGAPYSIYLGTAPGTVVIFSSPATGTYTDADATVTLSGGGPDPDAFGMDMDAGDIDGDGLFDLVVGAPRDPTAGDYAGAAWVFYGASGVFAAAP